MGKKIFSSKSWDRRERILDDIRRTLQRLGQGRRSAPVARPLNAPLFTDIDHLIIVDAFLSAIKAGQVHCLTKSIQELEDMTPNEILGVLIKGRGDGTVIGQFDWKVLGAIQ